jgi:hypothetical protein
MKYTMVKSETYMQSVKHTLEKEKHAWNEKHSLVLCKIYLWDMKCAARESKTYLWNVKNIY